MSEPESDHPASAPSAFAATRWTLVLRAGVNDSAGHDALAQLCRAYWLPLYVYARRRGYSAHDAEDLTQSFFAHLLRHDVIKRADPDRGRFRSFLLSAMSNHLHNVRDHAHAARRGGAVERVSFDAAEAADALAQIEAEALTPDQAFDRAWALALLDRALRRLHAEQERLGKGAWFERVRSLLQARVAPGEYDAIAAEFGLTKNAVAVAVHRLGARFRELVRAEIADTVTDPADCEREQHDLLGGLAS